MRQKGQKLWNGDLKKEKRVNSEVCSTCGIFHIWMEDRASKKKKNRKFYPCQYCSIHTVGGVKLWQTGSNWIHCSYRPFLHKRMPIGPVVFWPAENDSNISRQIHKGSGFKSHWSDGLARWGKYDFCVSQFFLKRPPKASEVTEEFISLQTGKRWEVFEFWCSHPL